MRADKLWLHDLIDSMLNAGYFEQNPEQEARAQRVRNGLRSQLEGSVKKGDTVRALRGLLSSNKDESVQKGVRAGRTGKVVRVSKKGADLGAPPNYVVEWDEGFFTFSNRQDVGPLHALEQLGEQAE